jgi:hypothetical protein
MNIFTILFLVALSIAMWSRIKSPATKSNTYEDYVRDHPNVLKSGSVRCHACQSSNIWVRRDGQGLFKTQTHCCRQCGAALYRS